jgi:site-specific DNA-methyltransferase (adenine-specific)
MLELNKIYCGDCLDLMQEMPDKSVDLVLTDLPFGTTQNEWDIPIPFAPMWEHICRIKKENTAIIFFGSGMFTAELMASNKKMWRYNLIWAKNRSTGFLNAAAMPLRSHEDILVFYSALPTYNPQMSRGNKNHTRGNVTTAKNNCYGDFDVSFETNRKGNQKFPDSILFFDRAHPPIHPTEKPVPLLEYLIKTYSNESDLVLDFCCGSGTTAEACIKSTRNFIGIEKEPAYVAIAENRLEKVNNHKITDFFGVGD